MRIRRIDEIPRPHGETPYGRRTKVTFESLGISTWCLGSKRQVAYIEEYETHGHHRSWGVRQFTLARRLGELPGHPLKAKS